MKRAGGGVGTFVDKVLDRNAQGFRGVVVVAVAALLAAWLTVELFAYWRGVERGEDRQDKLQQTTDLLNTQTMGSGMLGAVSLLGLSEPLLKDMARGVIAPDYPQALARLGVARERFLVQGVYVMSADGTVVAHETAGPRSTGINLAYSPIFSKPFRAG